MAVAGNKGTTMAGNMKSFEFLNNNEVLFKVTVVNDVPIEQICYNETYRLLAPVGNVYTKEMLEAFFETRVFDKQRPDLRVMLRLLGVPFYDPYLICRKTHGLLFAQRTWVRFEDEPEMTYEKAVEQLQTLVKSNSF